MICLTGKREEAKAMLDDSRFNDSRIFKINNQNETAEFGELRLDPKKEAELDNLVKLKVMEAMKNQVEKYYKD